MTFREHLALRLPCIDPSSRPWKDVHIDYENEIVTFELRNPFTLQLSGTQKYDWKAAKEKRNYGKYLQHCAKGSKILFGLEYIEDYSRPIFLVEGVFDALSMRQHGFQCLALMSNNTPKDVKTYLLNLPNTIAICDGDSAGLHLAKYTKRHVVCEEGEDPNSMPKTKLLELLREQL